MRQKRFQTRSRILLRVPIELRRSILEQLTDPQSLYNCIRSHRAWHDAFQASDSSSLIAGVICNGHPLAIALYHAKNIGSYSNGDAHKRTTFLNDFGLHMLTPGGYWSPPVFHRNGDDGHKPAREMASDYNIVRKLAAKFAEGELRYSPFMASNNHNKKKRRRAYLDPVPSSRELHRIEAAFYAFHVTQQVFPSGGRDDLADAVQFFRCLGVWESRAFVSVYKFLREKLANFHFYADFEQTAAGMLFRVPLGEVYPWLFEMNSNQHHKKFDKVIADGAEWRHCDFGGKMEEYEELAAVGRRIWLEDQGLVYKRSEARPVCGWAVEVDLKEGDEWEEWPYMFDLEGIDEMEEEEDEWTAPGKTVIRDAGIWDDERLLAWGGRHPTIDDEAIL